MADSLTRSPGLRVNAEYWSLWICGILVSTSATAQLIATSWYLSSVSDSIQIVSLVQAAQMAPLAILAIPAGVAADLWDRHSLMILSHVGGFLAIIALAANMLSGSTNSVALLALTAVLGGAAALHYPSWQASIGDVVSSESLPTAVMLVAIGHNISRTVGPSLGGIGVATMGSGYTVAGGGIAFLLAIAILARSLRSNRRVQKASKRPPSSNSLLSTLKLPGISVVLVKTLCFGVLASAVLGLLPNAIRDRFGDNPMLFALASASFGAGAVGLGLLRIFLVRYSAVAGYTLTLAYFAMAAATLTLAIASRFSLFCVAVFLGGSSWLGGFASLNGTMHRISPRFAAGKALAIYQSATACGVALGSWLWGGTADQFGIAASFSLASGGCLAAATIALLLHKLPYSPAS